MTDDNDYDLRALREFRGALDEPPDGMLARGRYRLADREQRPPRRRRQWVLASAGAAAAVVAVVGASALAGGGLGSGSGGQVGATKPAVALSAPGKPGDLPVTPGTRAPIGAPITGGGNATHGRAVAALDRLAGAAAGAEPLQLGAGKALHVKTYNLVTGPDSYIHEVWYDPATATPLRVRRTDGGVTAIDAFDGSSVTGGLGIDRFTPERLASWPTDPAALLSVWRHWSGRQYPGRDADAMIWKDAYDLWHASEPYWTPQQRATIYRAFAQMPAVVGTTATIGGRGYDLVCLPSGPTAGCVLFDSATGRYAGQAPAPATPLDAANVNLVDFGWQPAPLPFERRGPSKSAGGGPKPSGK